MPPTSFKIKQILKIYEKFFKNHIYCFQIFYPKILNKLLQKIVCRPMYQIKNFANKDNLNSRSSKATKVY